MMIANMYARCHSPAVISIFWVSTVHYFCQGSRSICSTWQRAGNNATCLFWGKRKSSLDYYFLHFIYFFLISIICNSWFCVFTLYLLRYKDSLSTKISSRLLEENCLLRGLWPKFHLNLFILLLPLYLIWVITKGEGSPITYKGRRVVTGFYACHFSTPRE